MGVAGASPAGVGSGASRRRGASYAGWSEAELRTARPWVADTQKGANFALFCVSAAHGMPK